MFVAITYRPKDGLLPNSEQEKHVLNWLRKKDQWAYTFEKQGEERHLHALAHYHLDNNGPGQYTRALSTIADKYPGNIAKHTVKCRTAYKGLYQEDSAYATYYDYMCKDGNEKLVENLKPDWKDLLADDVEPSERRKSIADEKLHKLQELFEKYDVKCHEDKIVPTYRFYHELCFEHKEWRWPGDFNKAKMEACSLHQYMTGSSDFESFELNYRMLQRSAAPDIWKKRKRGEVDDMEIECS